MIILKQTLIPLIYKDYWKSKDINTGTVMDWVGHTYIKMTMLVYAEINKDKTKKEYEKINCIFD